VKSYLPMGIEVGYKLAWITLKFSSFQVGGPSSSARSDGTLSGTGCFVPQLCATGGNRSYLDFSALTGGPWHPGYKTR
jgi:hypothetical protein